jgi:riboflavin kinase/FMN adenylyltransferase
MLILKEIKPNLIKSSCLALGFFDGVHLGHQRVILDAIKKAKNIDALSTVITFSRHPREVLGGKKQKFITTLEQKLQLLESLGVQATVIIEFDENLGNLSGEDYLKNILIKNFNPKTISVGYNHYFGNNKSGNIEFLKENQQKYGYELSVIKPIKVENHIVSSSLIRKLINTGEIKDASNMLGRHFLIENTVIHGEKRGRILGFPTANLIMPKDIIPPANGVYSGLVDIDSKFHYAIINVGKRPTFADLQDSLIEVHILNFDGDLYGQNLKVSFIDKIRDEKKFSSPEELKKQIKYDCAQIKALLINI